MSRRKAICSDCNTPILDNDDANICTKCGGRSIRSYDMVELLRMQQATFSLKQFFKGLKW